MESHPVPNFQEVVRHHAFFSHADCLVESDGFAAAFCARRGTTDGALGVEVVHVFGQREAVGISVVRVRDGSSLCSFYKRRSRCSHALLLLGLVDSHGAVCV